MTNGQPLVPAGALSGPVALGVLDRLNDAVIVADAHSTIIYANPAVSTLLGWRPDDLVGQPVVVLVPERLRSAHTDGFERYRRMGTGHIMGQATRVPALTRGGEERLIELLLSPLELGNRERAVAATLRDVGDRVDLERQSAVATHLLGVFGRDLPEPELIPAVLEALGRSLEMVATAFWAPSGDGNHLTCRAFWHLPGQAPSLSAISETTMLGRGEGLPGRVWAAGSPAWISGLVIDDNYPRQAQATADGLRSAFAFPVRARGQTLGVIELYTGAPAEPDGSLLSLSALIGRRLGEVIRSTHLEDERRRLAEREHAVAAAFRHSLLPGQLPQIPGVAIGTAFHPGGEDVVGGDFYDVYVAPGRGQGTTEAWGITIGDVCGTGAEAAAVTANVRYTARALIRAGSTLSATTHHINSALLERRDRRFCTCILGLVEQSEPGVRVRLANGGHLYPMHRRADGSVELVPTRGRVLGVLGDIDVEEVDVWLEPGDLLVLYTDGITEARRDGELFGEERLCELVASFDSVSASKAARLIQDAAQDFAGGRVVDDMAVLVLGSLATT